MELNNSENIKIEYVDSTLRTVNYHFYKILEIGDRLKEIASELTGELKSPSIKSKDESIYTSGPKIYRNNLIILMDEEDKLTSEIQEHETALATIGGMLKDLDENELDLLYLHYEKRLSLTTIGYMQGRSTVAVKKHKDRILAKL